MQAQSPFLRNRNLILTFSALVMFVACALLVHALRHHGLMRFLFYCVKVFVYFIFGHLGLK